MNFVWLNITLYVSHLKHLGNHIKKLKYVAIMFIPLFRIKINFLESYNALNKSFNLIALDYYFIYLFLLLKTFRKLQFFKNK